MAGINISLFRKYKNLHCWVNVTHLLRRVVFLDFEAIELDTIRHEKVFSSNNNYYYFKLRFN